MKEFHKQSLLKCNLVFTIKASGQWQIQVGGGQCSPFKNDFMKVPFKEAERAMKSGSPYKRNILTQLEHARDIRSQEQFVQALSGVKQQNDFFNKPSRPLLFSELDQTQILKTLEQLSVSFPGKDSFTQFHNMYQAGSWKRPRQREEVRGFQISYFINTTKIESL